MFLDRAVTRSTLVPGDSSISYRVTVGPRLKPVTWASTLNWVSVSVREATMASLASVRSFGMDPGVSMSDDGSVYVTSPASDSCSVRCGIGVGGGAGATGREGTCAAAWETFSEPAATMPGVTRGMASVALSSEADCAPWTESLDLDPRP